MKTSFLKIAFVFFMAGLFLFLYDIGGLFDGYFSTTWPSVMGSVTIAQIKMKRIPWRSHYREVPELVIEYTYTVENEIYKGDRVSAGRRSDAYPDRIISKYPANTEVIVHYHPNNHSTALLETGIDTSTYLYTGVGVLFLSIAFIFLIIGLQATSSAQRVNSHKIKELSHKNTALLPRISADGSSTPTKQRKNRCFHTLLALMIWILFMILISLLIEAAYY